MALAYAAQGIPVFPCVRGGKRPATAAGFKDATTDSETIRRMWAQDDYNVAICPEDAGWCVVDVDGRTGYEAWLKLCEANPTPATRSVVTPSGGMHYYFAGSLPASVRKIGSYIDTRGRGSYVLVPPSVVDGKPYKLVKDVPLAPLPQWITAQLDSIERPRMAAADDVELDTEANVSRARTRLRQLVARGDVAVEFEGGNDRTYRVATEIINLGLSEEGARDLIADEWNPYCQPPWDDDELEAIVGNAWRYKQNEAGAWAAGPIPDIWQVLALANPPEPPKEEPAGPFPTFRSMAELATIEFPPPLWVWDNRLLMGEPNLYTGLPGVGKTTLAENIAVAVANGSQLLGHDTRQQTVALLVAEDRYGPVVENLKAIRAAFQAPEECWRNIDVLSVKSDKVSGGHRLVTIADDGTVEDTPFMRHVAQWIAAKPGPVLWVIDPIAEFARFDRYKDEPCRALATTWLDAVCSIRPGEITPLVMDHPSKASVESGHHVAGSVQLSAAFTFVATLKGGQWSGAMTRQRDLTFSIIKGRYTAEEDTRFVRSSKGPAFVLQGGPNHAPDDHQVMVYRLVAERIAAGLPVNLTNHGFGPGEMAYALALDEKAVKFSLTALVVRQWLDRPKGAGGYVLGPKAPSASELDGF